VEFLGYVPDTQFYTRVDVVVTPSLWDEPLPRTVLEAFGYGLTVISTARGGIPEVVIPGETGYLIEPNKPEEMSAAIVRTIENPLEGRLFGATGRRMVVQRTEAVVAADYEAAALRVMEYAARRRAYPRAAVSA